MKIQQIKKLIMEKKHCVILTGQQGQQWIGGQDWMVRVDEGLKITSDSIKGLFDLDVDQMEKLTIIEAPMEQWPMWPVMKRDINTLTASEIGLDLFGGVELLTFGNAVYLLERKYVKASVSVDDYREFLLAWDSGNNPLIVIQDGLIFAGIARPLHAEVCKRVMGVLDELCALLPSGTRAPEENGPLKLEPEGGIQINMDDFKESEGTDNDHP